MSVSRTGLRIGATRALSAQGTPAGLSRRPQEEVLGTPGACARGAGTLDQASPVVPLPVSRARWGPNANCRCHYYRRPGSFRRDGGGGHSKSAHRRLIASPLPGSMKMVMILSQRHYRERDGGGWCCCGGFGEDGVPATPLLAGRLASAGLSGVKNSGAAAGDGAHHSLPDRCTEGLREGSSGRPSPNDVGYGWHRSGWSRRD